MNITIVFGNKRNNIYKCISNIIDILIKFGIKIFIDERYILQFNRPDINFTNYDNLFKISDIILAVGGDGTIIRIAKQASEYDKPVLGINVGRFGFLADVEQNKLDVLSNLIYGNYKISNRMMLEITIDDQIVCALNDISINREISSPIADYCISDSNGEIFNYHADGIIACTGFYCVFSFSRRAYSRYEFGMYYIYSCMCALFITEKYGFRFEKRIFC